jgi:hypothetical protein
VDRHGSKPTYKDILVIGEHKKSYDKSRFKEDFLQLTRYVRSVFTDQPTRRYIHGFLLCASMMELWIFDRSERAHMTVDGLEDIMGEFPTSLRNLKPLCLKIRKILFGDTARLFMGTPTGEHDQLYGSMIAAYDEAINNVKGGGNS